jgi:hypothetical protein
MKTETIDVLATQFQPIMSRHFVLQLPGIDSFMVESVHFAPLTVGVSGGKFYVVLHSCIAPSMYQQVEEILRRTESWITRLYNRITFNQKDKAVLKLLDPVGMVVNKFVFSGVKLVSVDHGSFEYSDNSNTLVKISWINQERKINARGASKKTILEYSFKDYKLEY